MTNERGYTLQDYRAAIRLAWLPEVGRERLSSTEYQLTESWFKEGIPMRLILQAIKQAVERARQNGQTIYSLGVVRADLEALKRKGMTSKVGAQPHSETDWRERWAADAEEIAILAEDQGKQELAAMYRELIRDLPQLTLEQATQRFKEMQS